MKRSVFLASLILLSTVGVNATAQAWQATQWSPAGSVGSPSAAAVTISSNMTIGCNSGRFENFDVTVSGATLTIDCGHNFRSLRLINGARLRHSPQQLLGMDLHIQDDLFIETGSDIDVSGLGYLRNEGPGAGGLTSNGTGSGASHGGTGGYSSSGVPGAEPYGEMISPTTPGSGGGMLAGGSGGGVVRITVGGTATIDGPINANGLNQGGGGGAGGTIYLEASQLDGAGQFAVVGGNGHNSTGHSGGGGGRIHIRVGQMNHVGNFYAYGGDGWRDGGAGTVFFDGAAYPQPRLELDNANRSASDATEFLGLATIAADVFVTRAAIMAGRGAQGLNLIIQGDLHVGPQGQVNMSSKGFGPNDGPGSGSPSAQTVGRGSGGSHGGIGGYSSSGYHSENTYGSWIEPNTAGSGGGTELAGTGGGVIKIQVSGNLELLGAIRSNGGGGRGGGAGGSIWLDVGGFSGTGAIYAVGGYGDNNNGDGGGGGGRIHVRVDQMSFDGVAQTYGGDGWRDGGAGTVYFDGGAFPQARLEIDNVNRSASGDTDFVGPTVINADVFVTRAGFLSSPTGLALDLTIHGDLHIGPQGRIRLTGEGFPKNEGPGAGTPSAQGTGRGSGGSHGGTGGSSSSGYRSGLTHGDISSPTTAGSGGGTELGGAGGGVGKVTVDGELLLEGRIEANGYGGRGGGAGGSIWLDVGTLSGDGVIYALGGNGDNNNGDGGGGGGRIAIEYSTNLFSGLARAYGGDGWTDGGPGPVFLKDKNEPLGTIIFDNANRSTSVQTEIPGTVTFPGDLVLRNTSYVGPASGTPGHFIVQGSMILEPTGYIYGTGRGYGPNSGPGKGSFPGFGSGSGAAHGGVGAQSSSGAPRTRPYGSIQAPITMGSGGGYLNGGSGGGALRLTIAGDAVIDGRMSMDASGGGTSSGGGAGGSLWITCNNLLGAGIIRTNGGTGHSNNGGSGGGGGRIDILCQASAYTGLIQACGGQGWIDGGAGTIRLEEFSSDTRQLIIANCSNAANADQTDLVEPLAFDGDLIVREQGILSTWPEQQLSLSITGDLTVEPDGQIYLGGKGHPANTGPGAGGLSGIGTGSGGGHGGVGGNSSSGATGGSSYGSSFTPSEMGSGGGYLSGGNGGGSAYITVDGTVRIDGQFRAHGGNGGTSSGGGSGGSIYLICDNLTGSGVIQANGGVGHSNNGGGGGGGGRIAIYTHCDPEFDIGLIQANRGGGWSSQDGEDGTIYLGYATPLAGDIVLTSSAPGSGLAIVDGTIIQDVFTLNNGPPPFDGSWSVLERHADNHDGGNFRCDPLGIIATAQDVIEVGSTTIGTGLLPGQYESSTQIRVFDEQLAVTLTSPLNVDAVTVGVYDEFLDLSSSSLPMGAVVNSHLVHFDTSAQSTAFLGGEVEFDSDILGLIILASELDASDSSMGIGGLTYPAGTLRRGLDFTDATDSIEILADRRTLRINARVDLWMDQIRVITEVPVIADMPYVASIAYLDGADEVSLDGCSAGFYRFTFDLPAGATNISLQGISNVCPQGVVYLNGTMISGKMSAPQCEPNLDLGPLQSCYDQLDANTDLNAANGLRVLTYPTPDCFTTTNDLLFLTGTNELIFAVASDASYWQPTGLEFFAVIDHD